MARKTDKVRIQLDFVLGFDVEFDSIPDVIGMGDIEDLVEGGIARVLEKRGLKGDEPHCPTTIQPGAKMDIVLDYRK